MTNHLNLIVDEIVNETHDTISILLHEKDNRDLSFLPGQFLTFIFDADGIETRRGYSIWTTPDDLPQVGVAIKKFKDGVTTKYLLESLKVGDSITSLPPLGNFTVETNQENERTLVMFGAGSGITPLMSHLQAILKYEPKSKVILFYGNHDEDSIIFYDKLNSLQKKYSDNFFIEHCLSKPKRNWNGVHGRIDSVKSIELLDKYKTHFTGQVEYYLCGPEEMMQTVMNILKERNVDRKNIHREIYTTKVLDETDEIEEKEREVTIILQGERHKVLVMPNETILEKALEQGLEIPNSCQFGNCSTCKAKLLSGKLKLVEQTALSEEDIKQGFCLTCVGYPASDNVVILYEDMF
ncbi:flavodoxin reductase (ferredoxin-nadph reductase) family 1 [hydrocarbon metagenome]|uniref:Flavodoxin reductase (Ferredoxin-nadph reductase) family 1 n=1 Tax=hydrocarbon metagenome TaxID=938273 RepID=A0A0W8FZ93_9ZZZZ